MGDFWNSMQSQAGAGIHAVLEQNSQGQIFVSSLLKGGQLAKKVRHHTGNTQTRLHGAH